jgi:hypothetical protein
MHDIKTLAFITGYLSKEASSGMLLDPELEHTMSKYPAVTKAGENTTKSLGGLIKSIGTTIKNNPKKTGAAGIAGTGLIGAGTYLFGGDKAPAAAPAPAASATASSGVNKEVLTAAAILLGLGGAGWLGGKAISSLSA